MGTVKVRMNSGSESPLKEERRTKNREVKTGNGVMQEGMGNLEIAGGDITDDNMTGSDSVGNEKHEAVQERIRSPEIASGDTTDDDMTRSHSVGSEKSEGSDSKDESELHESHNGKRWERVHEQSSSNGARNTTETFINSVPQPFLQKSHEPRSHPKTRKGAATRVPGISDILEPELSHLRQGGAATGISGTSHLPRLRNMHKRSKTLPSNMKQGEAAAGLHSYLESLNLRTISQVPGLSHTNSRNQQTKSQARPTDTDQSVPAVAVLVTPCRRKSRNRTIESQAGPGDSNRDGAGDGSVKITRDGYEAKARDRAKVSGGMQEQLPSLSDVTLLIWDLRGLILLIIIAYLVMRLILPFWPIVHFIYGISRSAIDGGVGIVASTTSSIDTIGKATVSTCTSIGYSLHAVANATSILAMVSQYFTWALNAVSVLGTTPPLPTVTPISVSYYRTFHSLGTSATHPISNYDDIFLLYNEARLSAGWLREAWIGADEAAISSIAGKDEKTRSNFKLLAQRNHEAYRAMMNIQEFVSNFTHTRRLFLGHMAWKMSSIHIDLKSHVKWEAQPGPTFFFPWSKSQERSNRIKNIHRVYMESIPEMLDSVKRLLELVDEGKEELKILDGAVEHIRKLLKASRKSSEKSREILAASTTGIARLKLWNYAGIRVQREYLGHREVVIESLSEHAVGTRACLEDLRVQLFQMSLRLQGEYDSLLHLGFRHHNGHDDLDIIDDNDNIRPMPTPGPPSSAINATFNAWLLSNPPLSIIPWLFPALKPSIREEHQVGAGPKRYTYILEDADFGLEKMTAQREGVKAIEREAKEELERHKMLERTASQRLKEAKEDWRRMENERIRRTYEP